MPCIKCLTAENARLRGEVERWQLRFAHADQCVLHLTAERDRSRAALLDILCFETDHHNSLGAPFDRLAHHKRVALQVLCLPREWEEFKEHPFKEHECILRVAACAPPASGEVKP